MCVCARGRCGVSEGTRAAGIGSYYLHVQSDCASLASGEFEFPVQSLQSPAPLLALYFPALHGINARLSTTSEAQTRSLRRGGGSGSSKGRAGRRRLAGLAKNILHVGTCMQCKCQIRCILPRGIPRASSVT